MGQARNRKKLFFERHNTCCFCGGVEEATTIDHVPNKDCFKGRAFPEGFEFPACEKCQVALRLDEQVFSFVVQMLDRNSDNYDREQARRAISGIVNNHPELAPQTVSDPADKIAALHAMGQPIPITTPLSDVPLIALPAGIADSIERVAMKIGLALFYRETGRIATKDHRIFAAWAMSSDRYAMQGIEQIKSMARFETSGWRPNLKFGDRLTYRWDVSENPDEDIFMAVVEFGRGLIITTFINNHETWLKVGDDDWVSVEEFSKYRT